MRTVRTLIIVAVLFVVCTAAKTSFNKEERSLSKNSALNIYISAVAHGKAGGIAKVHDSNAKFSILNGTKTVSFSKNEMPVYFKAVESNGKKYTTSTAIVENGAGESIVRVNMQSHDLLRSNYVTLANTGNGWKITNVYTVIK